MDGDVEAVAKRFGQTFLHAVRVGDRYTTAIALQHLEEVWPPERGPLEIFLLQTAIAGAPRFRVRRALLRYRLAVTYRRVGRLEEAAREGRLSLIERCFSRGDGAGSLKRRFWLAIAYLGIRNHPVARRLAPLSYRLAAILGPHR